MVLPACPAGHGESATRGAGASCSAHGRLARRESEQPYSRCLLARSTPRSRVELSSALEMLERSAVKVARSFLGGSGVEAPPRLPDGGKQCVS